MGMPPKKGPNVAMIALIALAVLVVSGFGGCVICVYIAKSNAPSASYDSPSGDDDDPGGGSVPAAENWITSERPPVKFLAPAGWTKTIKNDWAVFESADGSAVFAFTTFNRPGESTAKLGRAAWALGVGEVAWGSVKVGTLGQDNFVAHIGDGSCLFKGSPGGYIEYATVNAGSSDQILIIYAVSSQATRERKEEVQVTLRSLQRQ